MLNLHTRDSFITKIGDLQRFSSNLSMFTNSPSIFCEKHFPIGPIDSASDGVAGAEGGTTFNQFYGRFPNIAATLVAKSCVVPNTFVQCHFPGCQSNVNRSSAGIVKMEWVNMLIIPVFVSLWATQFLSLFFPMPFSFEYRCGELNPRPRIRHFFGETPFILFFGKDISPFVLLKNMV